MAIVWLLASNNHDVGDDYNITTLHQPYLQPPFIREIKFLATNKEYFVLSQNLRLSQVKLFVDATVFEKELSCCNANC